MLLDVLLLVVLAGGHLLRTAAKTVAAREGGGGDSEDGSRGQSEDAVEKKVSILERGCFRLFLLLFDDLLLFLLLFVFFMLLEGDGPLLPLDPPELFLGGIGQAGQARDGRVDVVLARVVIVGADDDYSPRSDGIAVPGEPQGVDARI